jgi:hypothetical protein
MSTPNPRNIGPAPQFDERARQSYGEIIARPKRNALGERAGERWAEEGLFEQYSTPFYEAQGDARSGASHQSYDAEIAGQANGRQEPGASNPRPTWDAAAVDDQIKAGFWQGTDGSEQSVTARPAIHQPRAGANRTITPLHGLLAGERPGATYSRAFPPPNGGRDHVNVADITEV